MRAFAYRLLQTPHYRRSLHNLLVLILLSTIGSHPGFAVLSSMTGSPPLSKPFYRGGEGIVAVLASWTLHYLRY
jgi:hypothetical protein